MTGTSRATATSAIRPADGTVLWLDVRGDPQELVHEELERRAQERVAAGGVIRAVTYATETDYQAFLAGRGYRHVQTSYRMYVTLDDAPSEVVWPEGIRVRAATEDETALVHAVYQETFSEHDWFVPEPFDDFDHHVSNVMPDRSLWFVAEDDGEVAGIAICRPHAEGDPASGWVSILGVRRPWRRRGLGEALLLHAFHEFRRRGLARVGLGVEADNATGAVRLYERAGMTIGWEWKVWENRT